MNLKIEANVGKIADLKVISEPLIFEMNTAHLDKYSGIISTQNVFIFDIDDCLYEKTEEVLEYRKKKREDGAKLLGITQDQLAHLFKESTVKYGHCFKSILIDDKFTEEQQKFFLEMLVDLKEILRPDEALKALLKSLNGQKYCLTNSNSITAKAILKNMELDDCFDGIFCSTYEVKDFICKPQLEAFEFVEKVLGQKGSNIFFFDDSLANITTAQKFGWNCRRITNTYTLKEAITTL